MPRLTCPRLVGRSSISYNDCMVVPQVSAPRRRSRRVRRARGAAGVVDPSNPVLVAGEPADPTRMVLRGDISIQPVGVPFLDVSGPHLRAARAERAAWALVALSLAVSVQVGIYALAAVL